MKINLKLNNDLHPESVIEPAVRMTNTRAPCKPGIRAQPSSYWNLIWQTIVIFGLAALLFMQWETSRRQSFVLKSNKDTQQLVTAYMAEAKLFIKQTEEFHVAIDAAKQQAAVLTKTCGSIRSVRLNALPFDPVPERLKTRASAR